MITMEREVIKIVWDLFLFYFFLESLMKQKWGNNKNALSGPLHPKQEAK